MIRLKAAGSGAVLISLNFEMTCAGPAFMLLAHGLEIVFQVIFKQLKNLSVRKFQRERVT